jgi:hypothetical protein
MEASIDIEMLGLGIAIFMPARAKFEALSED